MCDLLLMMLYGMALGPVVFLVFHTISWLVSRLMRIAPVLLGGGMTASMLYALVQIALGP
jgi:hypothetical protein